MDNAARPRVTELKTAVAEAYQVYMNEDATADEIRHDQDLVRKTGAVADHPRPN